MKHGLPLWVVALVCASGAGLLGACDENGSSTAPPDTTPLIEVVELTLNVDSGSPIALEDDGSGLAIVYTSAFGGSGDIYHLVVRDDDGDGYYSDVTLADEYPNENDSTINYLRPDHHQFTQIGDYEIDEEEGEYPSDPGNIYFAGPRHLVYDPVHDRVFYSMGYNLISQIASTVAPLDAAGGHTGEIVNTYDESLEYYSSDAGRDPIWDFWYTKKAAGESYAFTGGNHASVSPEVAGGQWLAYADTLLESYDRDGDGSIGEDPVGEIEVLAGGSSDFAPGIAGVDDDGDGDADEFDLEVAGIQEDAPAQYSYAWELQEYLPAWDDDEDGRIDEDRLDSIDNDGDGLFDEDPIEPPIDDDGDGVANEDPIDGIDNDEDGAVDEDPAEDPIDNDGDGVFNEDGLDFIDNDGDGLINEDAEGDMNGDGFPGDPGDDDGDGLADLQDPEVRHSNLRALQQEEYDPVLDDDEDGISEEDGDFQRNGIWVVKLGADGLPDESALPISLTDDGGRQPFFNPVGSDLIYQSGGDIYRIELEFTADDVTVTGSENLTASGALEGYPSYSDDGTRIVYASSEYGTADLFIRQADGSVDRVTNGLGQELFPRFTPNGEQILYEGWLAPAGQRRVMITVEELP